MDVERLRKAVIDKRFILSANPDWREGRACGLTDDKTEQKANDALTIILENIAELVVAYLIDARQSATSEDVTEAIGDLLDMKEHWCADSTDNDAISIDLAITALQAYQPWIPVSNGKPESEKHVLLCCEVKPSGKRYVCDGFYAQSKTITTIFDGDNNYEYDEETDEYYLIEGYYEIIKNWDDYSSIVIDDFVTHWKPLPEPPKGE